MDERYLSGAGVLAFLVLLLVLMYTGWRRRRSRQSAIAAPQRVPERLGRLVVQADDVLYVATTVAAEPLDRIAVHGLGFRARASLAVHEEGLVVRLTGEPDFFLPRGDVVAVGRSTWTIDRAVEPGGLLMITWRLGDTLVDSYFRVPESDDPSGLLDAVQSIIQTQTQTQTNTQTNGNGNK